MEFTVLLGPDGSVTFPALAQELVPVAQGLDPWLSVAPAGDVPAARYLAAKRTPVAWGPSLSSRSSAELWAAHAGGEERPVANAPSYSRLDVKIALAGRLLRSCTLCPWACGVDRMADETGFCGLGRHAYVSQEILHFGEESAIRPSHTIFLTGCSLRCVYCATGDTVERPHQGEPLRPADMAARIATRVRDGARTVSFVGGNPDQNVLPILETLRACDVDVPVVWNSNLYATAPLMELLDGIVDIHLADLKYGNDRCARRASGIPDYWRTVTTNLERAAADADVIVRHLLLPGHGDCCTAPVLGWLARRLPHVPVNLMPQYRPAHRVERTRGLLGRVVNDGELEVARALAASLGITTVDPRQSSRRSEPRPS